MKILIEKRDGFMRRMFKSWFSVRNVQDCDRCKQQPLYVGPDDALILQVDRPLSRSQIELITDGLRIWSDGKNRPLLLDGGVRIVGVRRSVGK